MTDSAASYVCGTADAPLLGETIGQSLELAVQRWSDREVSLLLCGVSPSGIPRCTPPLVTARAVARADAPAADAPAATVRLGDGTVAIHGATLLEGDLLIDGDYPLSF